jgi:uncharacterized membrane protein
MLLGDEQRRRRDGQLDQQGGPPARWGYSNAYAESAAALETHRELAQNPSTRSFWMKPASSAIAIMNLIANLPLLYHKPKNTRILH